MVELRSVSPQASPSEVAVIVAALAEVERRRIADAAGSPPPSDPRELDHWSLAGRMAHRRVGMTRGPWRLSGRLTRRVRA